MEDDDDISAFGSQTVDPQALCTTNEVRSDGWIFVKGHRPCRFHDVVNCYNHPGDARVGTIVVDEDDDPEDRLIECDDADKFVIFERVAAMCRQRQIAEDADDDEGAGGNFEEFMEFLMRSRCAQRFPDDD